MNSIELYNYLKTFLSEEKIEKFDCNIQYKTEYILPVFEDIYQFRNAAAIVRSLEGLGINKLIALEGKNVFKPEESVSRGAEKWIKIERKPHSLDSLLEIKNKGYTLACVSPEETAIDIENLPIHQPIALLFGTEWQGVSSDMLQLSDICVKIPMFGFTQSFNVSVAMAISVYTLLIKIRNSNNNWKLTEKEQLDTKNTLG